ncbi:hypothetical protein JCM6882_006348 [Rhodosporidiobolus microsporus]
MNDTSPPGYSAAPGPSLVLLNLAPPAEATTFQLGHLGYGPAFVAGDVQVKFAGGEGDARPAFSRLEVTFRGVERNTAVGGEDIELCEQTKVVWGVGAAGSSSAAAKYEEGGAFPPSSTAFKLELTPDLPACLHLANSSLEYTLTATLFYADSSILPLVRCAPVHLARTSPPGSLLASGSLAALSSPPPSTAPQTISATTPIPFSVRLPRTVFRRSEPVELVTRIEVPDAKLVGEGLRLRTVSAELIRTIKVAGGDRAHPTPSALSDGIEETRPAPQNPSILRTVLAHSGKSARFSPSRPIIIKLVLHPPAEVSCESITQATILHTISFSVVVTVGLVNHSSTTSSSSAAPPPPLDATLSQEIFIVPDLSNPASSSKQREANIDAALTVAESSSYAASSSSAWMPPYDGPVPTYVADSQQDSGETVSAGGPVASGSSSALDAAAQEQLRRNWSASPPPPPLLAPPAVATAFGDWEEEHDGYEDFSLPATLSIRPPPPPIDDDVSPPSAGDREGSLSLELAAAQGIMPRDGDDAPPRLAEFGVADEEGEEPVDSPPPPMFDAHDHPPPSHLHHHHLVASPSPDTLEPATPPPHIDFALPLSPSHAHALALAPLPTLPAHFSSTPPPASRPPTPLLAAHHGPLASPGMSEGLPPPYFGGSFGAPPPPPPPSMPAPAARTQSRPPSLERRYDPSFGTALLPPAPGSAASSASEGSSASASASGGEAEGTADVRAEGGRGDGGEDEEEEDDEPRPPPYESRDEMVRFRVGVNARGEEVVM